MPQSIVSPFRISGYQNAAFFDGPPSDDEACLRVIPVEPGKIEPVFHVVFRVVRTTPEWTYEAFVLQGSQRPLPKRPELEEHGTLIAHPDEQQTVRELTFAHPTEDSIGRRTTDLIQRLVNAHLRESQG